MKRIIAIVGATIALMLTMSGCIGSNVQLIDTTWCFDRAVIGLPNGTTVEGSVSKWGDFENSDMIQVEIDGKTYLTHSSNVVLISEKNEK